MIFHIGLYSISMSSNKWRVAYRQRHSPSQRSDTKFNLNLTISGPFLENLPFTTSQIDGQTNFTENFPIHSTICHRLVCSFRQNRKQQQIIKIIQNKLKRWLEYLTNLTLFYCLFVKARYGYYFEWNTAVNKFNQRHKINNTSNERECFVQRPTKTVWGTKNKK